MAATHEVLNQPTPLEDINLFQANQALREGGVPVYTRMP